MHLQSEKVVCKMEVVESSDLDNKRYMCASCHNHFDSVEMLVQHIKTDHAECDVAMIPCSVCHVVFMRTTTLFQHLDEHLTNFSDEYKGMYHECFICSKKFNELEALHVHCRLHKVNLFHFEIPIYNLWNLFFTSVLD